MAAGLAVCLGFQSAEATVFEYINNSVGTPAISETTAIIESIYTSFDDSNNQFVWEAVYSGDSVSDLPTGFTLVVNDGPMPKTHLGNLAVLYFEAEELIETNGATGTPTLTAYAYNGGSSASAHRTSDFRDVQSPTPAAPDQIVSSINGFAFNSTLNDFDDAGKKKRLMRIELDATDINNHTPLQSPFDVMDNQPLTWQGIGFAQMIGIWFHPFNNINPDYIENGPEAGFLEHGVAGPTVNQGWQVVRNNYGFFDVDGLQAIPEPATGLLLLVGAAALRRRR
ncbi:PEP-CTERM sorting domain-containing protein [Algisphaera agarilytica]|uniref:PEP-CTERM protein-sorting domain-containing protein n=1 Tax=Algisphaera agarilytica TaxID=1385975 RepID=A0A7X0LLR9_9BACT|nr:PEP-CTERM sorting domain-containing protein [Algisphaera agarilytica]MBB6431204.1 hypothetical protein [Algisphaera agarilytica]